MSTERESLLALDAFATRESIRVAVYHRAVTLAQAASNHEVAAEFAEAFLDFVDDERWKLDALDIALKRSNPRSNAENIIDKAQKIADWVKPEDRILKLDELDDTPKKGTKKK